jgi:thymidylate kinase
MRLAECSSPMKIISFSGIDGAGKSTQIAALKICLLDAGLQVKCLTFWDDAVVFSRLREFMSLKAFHGDQGIGIPERPLNRRDKNVASRLIIFPRLFLYLVDCINLRLVVRRMRKTGADAVIFDRYIYDELANLPLNQWLMRTFSRLVLRVSPQPDVALLIDADPKAARARKPEYPVEFLHRNRESYLALASIAREIAVIPPLAIEAAESRVKEEVLKRFGQSEAGLHAAIQAL